MNRAQLWEALKKSGITQSKRPDCPPDADLSVVIRHAPVHAKTLIDFICNLDSFTKKHTLKSAGDPAALGEIHE